MPARRTPFGEVQLGFVGDHAVILISKGSKTGDNAMKITDVTLTLFAWDDIPPTQYGEYSRFAGSSALGCCASRR